MNNKNPINELTDIQNRLCKCQISSQRAYDLIMLATNNFRTFDTAWWKERRIEFLKNQPCLQCARSSQVVQHLWHPEPIAEIRKQFFKKYRELNPYAYNGVYDPNLSKKKYAEFRNSEPWQREVMKEVITQSIRYLSWDDAVPFCSRCAYMWDVKHQHLCQICKKTWLALEWELCFPCFEESR